MRVSTSLMITLLVPSWSGLAANTATESSTTTVEDNPVVSVTTISRPTMHTFFERIDANERFTGMRDEDDDALLTLWNETWTNAGWNTRILTLADAKLAPNYDAFQVLLQNLQLDTFSRLLLERWMAMAAVGGGWMADYDVFPIRPFRKENQAAAAAAVADGMTLYDTVSPTLATGSATEWHRMAMALVENAQGHCQAAQRQQRTTKQVYNFWTDTLGIIHLKRNSSFVPPISAKRVVGPGSGAGPNLTSSFCGHKTVRSGWVVHFGPATMQRGQYIPPKLRLPKYRATVARDWLSQWYQACNIQWS